MIGCPSECIDGGVDDAITESVDVPGWEKGDFVDDEMWVSNHTTEGWIESGQTAGYPYGCCSLHRFFAAETTNGQSYFEYLQPGSISFNEDHDYVIQDLDHSGKWKIDWGHGNTGWEEVHTYGGYWAQTDELEAGFEGGANTQPYNEATQSLAGIWGYPYDEWHPWGGVYSKVFYSAWEDTCFSPDNSSWPGNANFGTPSC